MTPEVKGLVDTGVSAMKLLTRGKVKPSKKQGLDWLFDNLEETLEDAIDNASNEQLEVVGKKLCQIGWQILRDINCNVPSLKARGRSGRGKELIELTTRGSS